MSADGPRPGGRSGAKSGGCLLLIAFALLELGVVLGTAGAVFLLLDPILVAIIPAAERDFAHVLAIVFALIAAAIPFWYVDRWCKRVTGISIADSIPHFP